VDDDAADIIPVLLLKLGKCGELVFFEIERAVFPKEKQESSFGLL